jgi:Xaa-Pro aminopeptidase
LTRRKRAAEALAAEGLDALLVSRMTNIRYLTGFSGSAGFLVLTRDDAQLVVDFRYKEQTERETDGLRIDSSAAPPRLWPTLCSELGRAAFNAVGIEGHMLTVAQLDDLVGHIPSQVIVTANLIESLRRVKDPQEHELLRDAARLADAVFAEVCNLVEPGMTENDVAGEVERLQRRQGSERSAAPLIVASGERSALPHGVATQREIGPGDPVMFDLSPVLGGYRADLTRTIYLGPPSDEFERVYAIVRGALEDARSAVRAGLRASAIDTVARDRIAAAGYGDFFNHSLGHGVGLDQHEQPLLSPTSDDVLDEGMVVTIEPGIYLPGRFGVRIEDVVVVTHAGCDVLTTSDHDLRTL